MTSKGDLVNEVITAPRDEDRMRVEIAGDAIAYDCCDEGFQEAYRIGGTWRRVDLGGGVCVLSGEVIVLYTDLMVLS